MRQITATSEFPDQPAVPFPTPSPTVTTHHSSPAASSRRRLAILAGSIAALIGSHSAPAATRTWVGNFSPNFSVLNGFDGIPANGDTLLFGPVGSTGATLLDDIAALTVGGAGTDGIDFGLTASAYTINRPGTQNLTLGSSGIGLGVNDLSLNAETISVPLTLASTQTLNVGARMGSLTLSGVISGATFGLTTTGNGLLTLSGTNTYSGATTLSGDTVAVATLGNGGVAGSLGQASNAAANLVFDGGTLRFTGATAATDRSFTITPGKSANWDITTNTLTENGSAAATTGGLTKAGGGTLALGGATNLYTGNTSINQGTLKVDFTQATAPATDVINSGSTLVLGGPVTALGQLGSTFTNPTFNITGKASTTNSQTVNGLTLNPAISAVSVTANATANPIVLNLGAITHNAGGQVNFTNPTGTLSATNGITTNTLNDASGIIGAYATVGGTAFATNSTNAAGGNIVAYTGYTALPAGAIASSATANYQVQATGTIALTTADATTTDANTLSLAAHGHWDDHRPGRNRRHRQHRYPAPRLPGRHHGGRGCHPYRRRQHQHRQRGGQRHLDGWRRTEHGRGNHAFDL